MADSDNNGNSGFIDIDEKLKAEMFRFDCPSPLELGEYQLNLVPREEKQKIENHLTSCPYCREELDYSKQVIKTPFKAGKQDSLRDIPTCKVIPFKQEIIYHDDTAIPLEAVRSDGPGSENRKITIKVDKHRSLVMFYTITGENTHYVFNGQFVPDTRMENKIIGALIEVWQEENIRTTAVVDDLCAFFFTLKELTPLVIRVSHKEGTLLSIKLDLKRK
jgi:hypothetical protein